MFLYIGPQCSFFTGILMCSSSRDVKNVERERLKEMGNMGRRRRQRETEEECHLSLSHTSLHSIYPIYPESHILIGILQTDSTPNTLIHNSAKPPQGYLSSNTPTLSLLLVLSLSPSLHQPLSLTHRQILCCSLQTEQCTSSLRAQAALRFKGLHIYGSNTLDYVILICILYIPISTSTQEH